MLRPLHQDELAFLDKCRENARYLADTSSQLDFCELQALYDAFLELGAASEIAIAAVGVTFGDLLIRQLPDWIEWTTKDPAGQTHSELCVSVIGYELSCYPISMIGKRLDEVEPVNLEELAAEVLERLKALAAKGARQRWAN